MNEKNYIIDKDILAIGLTRSPMFMGVNIRIFFGNLVMCTLICIDAQTWFGIPLFALLHLTLVRFSIKDPNFLFVLCKAFLKTPPVFNWRFWGGLNSYEPW